VPTSTPPSINLCAGGTPTIVEGGVTAAWNWGCLPTPGTMCYAPLLGSCGPANNTGTGTKPSGASNLCNTGTPTTVSGSGPWAWTCSGSGGSSTNVSCATSSACGSANGSQFSSKPTSNLCLGGETPSSVSGPDPWSWDCTKSGITVSCSALVVGACGPANGSSASSAPTSNLCKEGTASSVTGSGPWDWTCQGDGGTSPVSCETGANCAAGQTVSVSPELFYSATFPGAANGTNLSEPDCSNACCGSGCGYINATCSEGNWINVSICWAGFTSGICGTNVNCPIGPNCPVYPS